MNAIKITLDAKSPAVTFATLPCGTVLACEPDGSRIISWSTPKDDKHRGGIGCVHDFVIDATDALAFVRTQYQRANVARLNAALPDKA